MKGVSIMVEKELYVLKYINEKINGNENIKYNCDIEEEYAINEIAHYIKRLLSKRYVIGKQWSVLNDKEISIYKNKILFIYYENLQLTKVGIKEINKK